MTTETPALTNGETLLLALVGKWSGAYLVDPIRIALAESLEAKGLVTIDRSDSPQILVALINPPVPVPMPLLTVISGGAQIAEESVVLNREQQEIAGLKALVTQQAKQIAVLKRKLDLEEGFSGFLEGKYRREE